ncbi:type II toxin-antitoxin system PemK/MazF family toxin [Priestia flexa]|uniref:type II toxin-antitoxin system PemK/MazF family toxin n=1 Tax=Priestia flexa TaxID=86664 RepID=UPI003F83B06F
MEIKRGDIFIADLDPALGSEEGKERRVLIVSNDIGNLNPRNSVVLAVPITGEVTEKRLKMPMYVLLKPTAQNGQTKTALIDCFQIRVLSIPHRIKEYKGYVDSSIMEKVDQSLQVSLGLNRCPKCDFTLLPNKKHCIKCKHVLVLVCKGCTSIFDSSHKYCPQCGIEKGGHCE